MHQLHRQTPVPQQPPLIRQRHNCTSRPSPVVQRRGTSSRNHLEVVSVADTLKLERQCHQQTAAAVNTTARTYPGHPAAGCQHQEWLGWQPEAAALQGATQPYVSSTLQLRWQLMAVQSCEYYASCSRGYASLSPNGQCPCKGQQQLPEAQQQPQQHKVMQSIQQPACHQLHTSSKL